MSEEIIRASFLETFEEDFIPMFVATPRQVDADRGYTGWSQRELVEFIRSAVEETGYSGPYLIARDHGGPYQGVRDRDNPQVSLEEAMKHAKETFIRDLRAGFDIIHVDATENPRIDGNLDLDEVARRTVELIVSIEEVRERRGLSRVYYEVGTEEITGGITQLEDFEEFIQSLRHRLAKSNEKIIGQLLFIVGQVGTTMRIDMINNFDPDRAERLVNIASEYGLFLKVHYADWLDSSALKKFPELGVGSANVGPEFAASIVEALENLEEKEDRALSAIDKDVRSSDFTATIEEAAVRNALWKMYAPKNLRGKKLERFSERNRAEIAKCVGRYVMNYPEVKKSRERLYNNLQKYTSVGTPDQFVVEKVREAIHRFVKAFAL